MRNTFFLATVLGTTGLLGAQSVGWHMVFPDTGIPLPATMANGYASVSFIGRGGIPPTETTTYVLDVLPDLNEGIGNTGSGGTGQLACSMLQVQYVLQDQDATQQEQYQWGTVDRDAMSGAPDPATENLTGLINFPPPPTGQTGAAYVITLTFQNPVTIDCGGDFFHGIKVPANANWPQSDGLSIQYADETGGTFGDNPRMGSPGMSWAYGDMTTIPAQLNEVPAYALGVSAPTLRFGAEDPNSARTNPTNALSQSTTVSFGSAGYYPDVIGGGGRSDGIQFRLWDANNANGSGALVVSVGLSPMPIPFGGFGGDILFDLTAFVVTPPVMLDANGIGTGTLAPPNSIPNITGMNLVGWGQGITFGSAGAAFTNASGVSF